MLNSKQQKTLEEIFETPTRSNILWTDVESLFLSLGATVQQGKGSRVRVALNGVKAVFHEPHPQKEVSKCTVKDIKEFLINANVTP
ncbi:MAG: type II toxin-antitoxin system HicA family toxin [Scytonema sp. RU_4_4]|nr:type II toxin-antitoxin system HicA family toxin [Scytonema sp. RU_4_4]